MSEATPKAPEGTESATEVVPHPRFASEASGLPEYLARHGIQEKWVQLSHGWQRYFVGGSGPPLITLHGSAYWQSADKMLLFWPELMKRYRLFGPDLLHWGPGTKAPFEYSSTIHVVHALREFMDAMDIDSSFIASICYGSQIAMMLTAQSPQRVRGLVCGSLATHRKPIPPSRVTTFELPTSAEQIRRDIELRLGSDIAAIDYDAYARWTWDTVLRSEAHEKYVNFLRHSVADVAKRQLVLQKLHWASVRTPVLLMWSDDDHAAPVADGRALHALVPSSKLVICAGDHFVQHRHPDGFIALIQDFFTVGATRDSAVEGA